MRYWLQKAGRLAGRLGPLRQHAGPTRSGQVLRVRHGLKVLRVDAATVAAEMIDHQPFGDRADVTLVGETMSREGSAVVDEVPISRSASTRSCPLPTRLALSDVVAPAVLDRHHARRCIGGEYVSSNPQPGVVHRTHPQTPGRALTAINRTPIPTVGRPGNRRAADISSLAPSLVVRLAPPTLAARPLAAVDRTSTLRHVTDLLRVCGQSRGRSNGARLTHRTKRGV